MENYLLPLMGDILAEEGIVPENRFQHVYHIVGLAPLHFCSLLLHIDYVRHFLVLLWSFGLVSIYL